MKVIRKLRNAPTCRQCRRTRTAHESGTCSKCRERGARRIDLPCGAGRVRRRKGAGSAGWANRVRVEQGVPFVWAVNGQTVAEFRASSAAEMVERARDTWPADAYPALWLGQPWDVLVWAPAGGPAALEAASGWVWAGVEAEAGACGEGVT